MPFFWLSVEPPMPIYQRPGPYRKTVQEVDRAARPEGVREEGEPEAQPPIPAAVVARSYHQEAEQRPREPAVTAEQIMTRDVRTLTPDLSVKRAREMMRQTHIQHIPVVDESGKLRGIVSDRDLLRQPESRDDDTLEGVMKTKLLVASLDTEIRQAAQIMADEEIHCLPIVGDDRQLLGILTSTDVLRCVVHNAPLELWLWADRRKVSDDGFHGDRSKAIIDDIDLTLAKHFGVTDLELDFIVNYDIK